MQCEVASQWLPEDRGVDSVDGVFEKAAGKKQAEVLSQTERDQKEPNVTSFCFLSSPVPLPALMPTVMRDSSGHTTWKDFCSGGLPANTA